MIAFRSYPYFLKLRFISLVLLFFVPLFLQAQITTVDLLKKNLELVDNDTLKMELLIKIGNQYIGSDSEYAVFYLNKANELANSLNHQRGIAMTKLYMGRAYYYSDKYDLSDDYYEEAYAILKDINYQKGISEYYFFKGALQNLLNKHNKALESYHSGIDIMEELDDQRGISICLNGIGRIHFDNKDHTSALDYFERSLDLKRALDDQTGEATVLNNIGEVYECQGDFSLAMKYYLKALEIRQQVGENRKTAVSYRTIGKLETKTGKYNEAKINLNKALRIFKQLNEKAGVAEVLLDLSTLHLKMDDLEESVDLVEQSLTIAKSIRNKTIEAKSYKVHSEILFLKNNYNQAYLYLLKYNHLSDSLTSVEERKQFVNLKARYQMESKNQQIQILDGRNKIQEQQLFILYISIIAMVLAIGLLISFFRYKTVSLKQKNTTLKREKQAEHHQLELKEKESNILAAKYEVQSKELVSKAILMNKTNEVIQQNIKRLKQLSINMGTGSKKEKKEISDITNALDKYSSESLWDDFEVAFLNVHNGFYDKILNICPDLTPSEIKMAALLRLNLSSKEIEALTFRSESSIKSLRFRLRKKIGLDSDKNLTAYLMKL